MTSNPVFSRGFLATRPDSSDWRVYFMDNDHLQAAFNPNIRLHVQHGNPIEAIQQQEGRRAEGHGNLVIEEIPLLVGYYFPGIARPISISRNALDIPDSDHELELARSIWRELQVLSKDLEQCFDVNTLSVKNWNSYGTQYEKILYFACIGVESCFRRALTGGVEIVKTFNMNDYARLKDFLHLTEYSVLLTDYPKFDHLNPFLRWNSSQPSASLSWFQAYNKLKHDKRGNDHLATMGNALEACAAYYVAAYATFGTKLFPGFLSTHYYFQMAKRPTWTPTEIYYPKSTGEWTPLSADYLANALSR